MSIRDAVTQINLFRGHSLRKTISAMESQLEGAEGHQISEIRSSLDISQDLISSAAAVKRASAQIDVIIHSIGIIYCLPLILDSGELIENLSLGAGSAGSDFDVETNKRIAEFKFINWQERGNAVRKKTLFQDYFKLIRAETDKNKYFYLLNTQIPLRFLNGRSNILRLLDRNNRLKEDFVARYGKSYETVGEFFRNHRNEVHFVNLTEVAPELELLVQQ